MRTARSRTSGENRFDFLLMTPSPQRLEPPQNPGRFKAIAHPTDSRLLEQGRERLVTYANEHGIELRQN